MKKIAIIINSLSVGGAERFITIFIDFFKNKYDIHLILLYDIIELPFDKKGVNIFYLSESKKSRIFFDLGKIPFLTKRLHAYLQENKIGVVFSLLSRPNYISCILKKNNPFYKVIISERTCPTEYNKYLGMVKGLINKSLIKKYYPYADFIIPNSFYTKKDLVQNYSLSAEKIFPIYNPVKDIPSTSNSKPAIGMENKFVFVWVAKFRASKNHVLLLNAFARLNNPNTHLLLIGYGEEEDLIEKEIERLKISELVTIIKNCNNPYPYLKAAHVFVSPSNFEGFPNVLLEALQVNLPIISTDCKSGPREILSPSSNNEKTLVDEIEYAEYGILVPVNNCKKLTEAMHELYYNKELHKKYVESAKERVKLFAKIDILKNYEQIIFFK